VNDEVQDHGFLFALGHVTIIDGARSRLGSASGDRVGAIRTVNISMGTT
jgi:hypothetical protein